MRKIKITFVLATLLAMCIGFSSCGNKSLVETTWVWEESGSTFGYNYYKKLTLTFTTESAGKWTRSKRDGSDRWTEGEVPADRWTEGTGPFTYSFNDHNITIKVPDWGDTLTGTVKGSTMTLTDRWDTVIFIRQ